MARLSPVEMDCPRCNGVGTLPEDFSASCPACGRIGKTWVPGAPSFGCKMTLSKAKVGEIVTLGNGDRGRVLRHDKRGTPTAHVALIGDFDGVESYDPTTYPACTGVSSIADPRWFTDDNDHAKSHEDQTDPMRNKNA